MFHVELQSWLTQSIELTCSRTFRCLNMCHALCFLVYMSIQLTLFRKPCRCVCPDPRAGDAPRPGPRPSSTASRSWPTARGSARSSASTVLFLIRVEVRSGREAVPGGRWPGALRVSVCVVRVCRPELTFSQSWSVPCVSIHKGRFN